MINIGLYLLSIFVLGLAELPAREHSAQLGISSPDLWWKAADGCVAKIPGSPAHRIALSNLQLVGIYSAISGGLLGAGPHPDDQESLDRDEQPSLQIISAVVPGFRASRTVAKPALVCRFDQQCDRDLDGWPDEWFRERSPEFPRHPIVRIVHRGQSIREIPSKNVGKLSSSAVEAAASQLCSPPPLSGLFICPEGGGVSIARPVTLSPFADYLLRVEFEVRDLLGVFVIELETQDTSGHFRPQKVSRLFLFNELKQPTNSRKGIEPTNQPAQSEGNNSCGQSSGLEAWLYMKGDPRKKLDCQGVVRLRVYPTSRSRREGEVWIRSVTLWQIPPVETTLLPAGQIAPLGAPVEGKIRVFPTTSETRFPQVAQGEVLLEDQNGNPVAEISLDPNNPTIEEQALKEGSPTAQGPREETSERSPAEAPAGGQTSPIPGKPAGTRDGNLDADHWGFQLLPPRAGYYRIVIRLFDSRRNLFREEIWPLVVLPDLSWTQTSSAEAGLQPAPNVPAGISGGESRIFGWSLPLNTLSTWGNGLAEILPQSDIDFLRFEEPEPDSPAFRLSKALDGIQSILRSCRAGDIFLGLLLSRPASPHEEFSQRWGKYLGTFPPDLLPQIQWLQLGDEAHPLCASQQEAEAELLHLSRTLPSDLSIREVIIPVDGKSGQTDRREKFMPALRVQTCVFANWQGTKPKASPEGPGTTQGSTPDRQTFGQSGAGTRTLASISIASSKDAPISQMAAHLVQGLCQAAAADSAWILLRVQDELLPRLLWATGGPGELFLPWWISTELLRQAKPIGRLPVETPVTGWIFSRKGEGLLVIWSEEASSIPLTLPHGARVIDPWGQSEEISRGGDPTFLSVGPLPKFILCQDFWPLAWQKDCRFEPSQLLPYPGTVQRLKIQFTNPADFPVRGTLLVSGPPGFRIHPFEFRYHLGPRETFESTVQITAPPHALEGGHNVRWLFRFEEPENITMAIHRPVQLRWPGLDFGGAKLLSNPPGKVFQVDLYNRTGSDLHLILELFGLNRKRAALPPQVFAPGQHQIRIPLEEGTQETEETFILQVREVNGPRRIRILMKPTH